MPKAAQLLVALCVLGATACGGSDSQGTPNDGGAGESGNPSGATELGGTFTFGGETADCKTSTQDFAATGEFSVVCENDEDDSNYRFVQVTFKDEPSARTAQTLTFMAPFAFKPEDHEAADAVAVSYTNKDGTLDSEDDSTGSAKVTASGGRYVITLDSVSLSTVTSEDTGEVSATINF
ncbi:MAG: hypothetical protein K0R38_6206 [Polyangiaceae bacterium]|jgi:major membrane immunogen (membrane-anchored lipoprotein)|nr:hypothetical protein [Polyangiaceae bacterium]